MILKVSIFNEILTKQTETLSEESVRTKEDVEIENEKLKAELRREQVSNERNEKKWKNDLSNAARREKRHKQKIKELKKSNQNLDYTQPQIRDAMLEGVTELVQDKSNFTERNKPTLNKLSRDIYALNKGVIPSERGKGNQCQFFISFIR